MLAAAVLVTACGRTPSPEISLAGTPNPTSVEVRGLPSRDVAALSALAPEQWPNILRVEVSGATQAIAGRYTAKDSVVTFTPMYGFDGGRSYVATFNAALVPGAGSEPWRQQIRQRSFQVGLGPLHTGGPIARSTVVRQVYPSGETLPENMLRFYIEFSAPMGRGSALEHIRLEDETGKVVDSPFLPVEAEFWDPQRTRFTLFFDPGRVKRGIKPNRDLGRALVAGKRYALVIDARWLDGQGQMLHQAHRHVFTAARAQDRGLDIARWTIAAPRAGSRDALVVTFPWALDYGLLQRALSVHSKTTGSHVVGDVATAGRETEWMLVPRDPWVAGDYTLRALTLLEDPAGNRIGRAFEVMTPVKENERVEIGFSVR